MMMVADPLACRECLEQSTVEAARRAIVDVLHDRGLTQLGDVQASGDTAILAVAEAASFFDTQGQAIAYRVRTEDELEDALAAASDREALVLIELVMNRLDAPGPLVNFRR
jgi:hypothetical protein